MAIPKEKSNFYGNLNKNKTDVNLRLAFDSSSGLYQQTLLQHIAVGVG